MNAREASALSAQSRQAALERLEQQIRDDIKFEASRGGYRVVMTTPYALDARRYLEPLMKKLASEGYGVSFNRGDGDWSSGQPKLIVEWA
jgi:hypothetical protein